MEAFVRRAFAYVMLVIGLFAGLGLAGGPARAQTSAAAIIAGSQPKCDAGDVRECARLYQMYDRGQLVPKDNTRATIYSSRLCDLKFGVGCFLSGNAYDAGSGVAKDQSKARHLWATGCDLKDGDSCDQLGWHFFKGNGISADPATAVTFFQMACDVGSAGGCLHLGVMTEQGATGTSRNDGAATRLVQKACDLKLASACDRMGLMIERDGLVDDVKTLAVGICKDSPGLGCNAANARPVLSGQGDPAEVRAKAIAYFRQALAIDPTDKTAMDEIAEINSKVGAEKTPKSTGAPYPAPPPTNHTVTNSADWTVNKPEQTVASAAEVRKNPQPFTAALPSVPEKGGPGFVINVDGSWVHHRDEQGNYRLLAPDHSATIMISVILLKGDEGDIDDSLAREILKASSASPFSGKRPNDIFWPGSARYDSTLSVGTATWPMVLSIVHIDKTHVGTVTVLYSPDMTEQQQLTTEFGMAGVLVRTGS